MRAEPIPAGHEWSLQDCVTCEREQPFDTYLDWFHCASCHACYTCGSQFKCEQCVAYDAKRPAWMRGRMAPR